MLTLNGIPTPTITTPRSRITQETYVRYTIPMHRMKTWDNRAVNIPAAAANDDMGLITGTFGTDVPVLQSEEWQTAAPASKYCAFQFALPAEYDNGNSILIRLRCAMITTISDDTATIDLECYRSALDGAAGGDICTTVAQDMKSLTPAFKNFTITDTGLFTGDLLDFRLTFGGNDNATGTAVISQISQVEVLLDIRG